MTIIEDYSEPVGPIARLPVDDVDPSILDTAAAAFRLENTLSSAIARGLNNEPEVEGYNPFDDISGYEDDAMSFVRSRSPRETQQIKWRIDQQRLDRRVLQHSGGIGVAAAVSAGILDPLFLPAMLVPGSAVIRGEGAVSAGLKGLGAGAAGATVTEIPLWATQETRTGREAAVAIAASSVLSGLFGAGMGALSNRIPRDANNKTGAAVWNDMRAAFDGGSVGARSVRDTTMAQETLEGTAGAARALQKTNPLLRTAQSPSKTTRQIAQDLAESAFITRKNTEGIATQTAVETLVKRHDARIAFATEFLDGQYAKLRTGKPGGRLTRLKVGARDLLSREKGMSFSEFKRQVSRAMRRGDNHPIAEVAAAAKYYRQNVFEPLKNHAIRLGILPKNVTARGAESYLSRLYSWKKIEADRPRFARLLAEWFQMAGDMDSESARHVAEATIENIRHVPAGLVPRGIVPKAGALKSRELTVPDHMIEEFLEHDIELIAHHYVRTMAPELELVERFGRKDMADQMAEISEEYAVLIERAESPQARAKLAKAEEADIRDLEAMRDRLIGTFSQPNDPGAFIVRAGRVARDYNYLRLLGGMVVSSMVDVARPVMRHGFRAYAKGIAQLVTSPAEVKIVRRELKAMGVGLDMVLNTRAKAIAEIGEISQFSGAVERGTQNLANNFGIVSLMAPWNSAWKQFAGTLASNEIIHQSGRWAKGTIGKGQITKLAAAGIDEDMARRITRQIAKHGDDGGVTLPHAHLWDDEEASKVFTAAILRDADVSIVTPGIGDRPLFMSNEVGKLAMQFKSFQFAATNRVFIAGLQQRDMATMNGMLLTLALGSLVYGIKTKLAGKEISEDPAVLLSESLDRSGLTGIIMDTNAVAEKFSRGTVGVSGLTGGPALSRYQSRNVWGALLGPTIDAVEDLNAVTGAVTTGEFSEGDVRALRELVPYQNVFYMRRLFNEVEQGVAETVAE